MDFQLSEYQEKILDYFLKNPSSNMLINSFAGSGKSSTALMLTEHTTTSDVYVAFNNSIAKEFRDKIKNPKTKVYTMHSLAYSIMNSCLDSSSGKGKSNSFGKSRSTGAQLDNLKIYKIIDKELEKTSGGRYVDFTKKVFLENGYVQLYNLCRLTLTDIVSQDEVMKLIEEYHLFDDPEGMYSTPGVLDIMQMIRHIDNESMKQFDKFHVVDFTDMLYITYIKLKSKEWQTPYWNLYTNIYCDEIQDFSNLQLSFLPFIKRKNGRFVCIGDKNQSLYAFAGGNARAFDSIPKRFAPCETFDLPICYRCPEKHLAYVQGKFGIPIQCRPNVPKGKLKKIEKEEIINYVKPGDMVVARKNKWLADVIEQLVSNGIKVIIEDKEFVKETDKFISKAIKKGSNTATQIGNYAVSIVKKAQSKDKKAKEEQSANETEENKTERTEGDTTVTSTSSSEDMATFVYKIVASYLKQKKPDRATDFQKYLSSILTTETSPDAVRLCSVHKAKGLEAENVFVLNEGKVCFDFRNSKEQNTQEKNLAYVSLTRAKNAMYLVNEPTP